MPRLDNLASVAYFLPELCLVAGFLLVVIWDLATEAKTRMRGTVALSMVALAASAGFCAWYWVSGQPQTLLFYGLLSFDSLSHLFRIVFAFVGVLILVLAGPGVEMGAHNKCRRGAGEFAALVLAITFGLNLMAMSRNLLMIYLSMELVSVLSFVLAGFKPRDRKSSEAALKYVIFGAMASGVMLYGMSWLYGFSQSLDLATIAEKVVMETSATGRIPLVVLIGVVCCLAGFGYKISVAPFHQWTPDVYEGAPTSVTSFLSVGPKAAGFAVLIRFFFQGLQATSVQYHGVTPWAMVLGLIAILTMIVGNFTALQQDNVKRMLAYSSVAHAGTMLLGLCVFDQAGMRAIVFYVLVYALMNTGAFLVVLAVAKRSQGDETLQAFAGLGTRAPVLSVAMTIFLFSLAGIPPFGGFIGKFCIFAALIQAGGSWNWTLAVVGVINTVVSLFYYARVLRAMYFTKPRNESPLTVMPLWRVTTVALAVGTLVLGVYWGPVYEIVRRSVAGY